MLSVSFFTIQNRSEVFQNLTAQLSGGHSLFLFEGIYAHLDLEPPRGSWGYRELFDSVPFFTEISES